MLLGEELSVQVTVRGHRELQGELNLQSRGAEGDCRKLTTHGLLYDVMVAHNSIGPRSNGRLDTERSP